VDKVKGFMAHFAHLGLSFGPEFLPPPFNVLAREAIEQLQGEAARSGQTIEEVIAHARATFPLIYEKSDAFQARLERDAANSQSRP
jgi:hypothetical protein